MKPFRYVQSFVDRKTGAVFHYFRRRGYPRVRLPGLPGSREFMEAYQRASKSRKRLSGTSGRRRAPSMPRSSATTTSSMFFGSLAPSTQAIRRQILERFRAEHGDKPIALLPKRFIVLMLGKMKPSVGLTG